MTYVAFVSIYVFEFSRVIKLLLCLQFLNSKFYLNPVKYSEITVKYKVEYIIGARGGVVVKALHYKPAGRGFDSRWCQDFSP